MNALLYALWQNVQYNRGNYVPRKTNTDKVNQTKYKLGRAKLKIRLRFQGGCPNYLYDLTK